MTSFSIIIPVYNAEKYLERLINSIEKQTFKEYEVIIVNDGSTDNSLKILQKYEEKYENIKVINKKNEGPGKARKIGFKNANNELVFFIDSDDYLQNDKVLDRINEIYENNKFDVLFFDFISIRKDKPKVKNLFINKKVDNGYHKIDELDNTITEGALWGKIMKRSLIKEEYFIDSDNFEDYYTSYLYLENCSSFYYTNEIFYVADKSNKKSLTSSMSTEKIEKAIDIIFRIYNITKLKNSIRLLALHYYIYRI